MRAIRWVGKQLSKWRRAVFGLRATSPLIKILCDPPPVESLLVNNRIPLGKKLGRGGGQGQVYEVVGHSRFVYKQFYDPTERPLPIEDSLEAYLEIVRLGELLDTTLLSHGVFVLWPLAVFGEGDAVDGYLMRMIPQRFYLDMRTPYGVQRKLATLDYALPLKPRQVFRPVHQATLENLLEILQQVALFLNTLHRHDMVYSDISFSNVLFSLDPVGVLIMDLDPVHNITRPLISRKDNVHTPDWADPLAKTGQEPYGFDLDRYKFSLLVYRLLGPNENGQTSINLPTDPHLSCEIPSPQREKLEFVLSRATGPRGSRPPIEEWLGALRA